MALDDDAQDPVLRAYLTCCVSVPVVSLSFFYHPWLMQVGAVSYVTGSVASFELYLRFLAKLLGKVNLFPSVSLLPLV